MLDFNSFLEETTNEPTNSDIEDDELNYDIEEVINTFMSKNV